MASNQHGEIKDLIDRIDPTKIKCDWCQRYRDKKSVTSEWYGKKFLSFCIKDDECTRIHKEIVDEAMRQHETYGH